MEDDDNGDQEEPSSTDWKLLLDENDGVYSLKSWKDVLDLKAIKVNIALACREIMRQAWSECHNVITILSFPNPDFLGQSGRRGKITWGVVNKNPLKLIHPRFILNNKIGDPNRMRLKDLEAYWKDWVLKESEGDPFSFRGGEKGKGTEKGKEREQEDEEEEGEEEGEERQEQRNQEEGEEEENLGAEKQPTPLTPDFVIDHGIPIPCQCDTFTMRTTCLQGLAPKWINSRTRFNTLVKLVDDLEVGSALIIYYVFYLIIFRIQIPQVGFRTPNGHSSNGHGIVFTWMRRSMKTIKCLTGFCNG
jgi:hypothetical protein